MRPRHLRSACALFLVILAATNFAAQLSPSKIMPTQAGSVCFGVLVRVCSCKRARASCLCNFDGLFSRRILRCISRASKCSCTALHFPARVLISCICKKFGRRKPFRGNRERHLRHSTARKRRTRLQNRSSACNTESLRSQPDPESPTQLLHGGGPIEEVFPRLPGRKGATHS